MSIVRQVPWDEFTNVVGSEKFGEFVEDGRAAVVVFITDWSFPSRLALKKIKKMHFEKKRCGIIDVDLVDSIGLVNQFEVLLSPNSDYFSPL